MFGNTILILAPHPDDEVVGADAAIARARAAGSRVLVAFLTTGVPARALLWPWARRGHPARVARRLGEAHAAAADSGVTIVRQSELATRELKSAIPETLAAVRELLTDEAVDTVWVPAYEGGHQDHDVANFIGSRLTVLCDVFEFAEYHNATGRTSNNAFISHSGDELVLELSAAEQVAKTRRLGLYRSERGNLGYVTVTHERFRPLARYDYANPPHEGKMFYQRFQWVPYHPRIDYTKPVEVCAVCAEFAARDSGADAVKLRKS